MKRLLILFLLLSGLAAFADSPEEKDDGKKLPEDIYLEAIEQIGNQAWLTYQKKLLQLIETYTFDTDETGTFVDYKSQSSGVCPNNKRLAGVIYSMKLNRRNSKNKNEMYVKHYGCGQGQINEQITVTGDGQYSVDPLKIYTGIREFTTPVGQTSLEYVVRNRYFETLFRTREENLPNRRRFIIFLKDSILAEFLYDKKTKEARFTSSHGFSVQWKFNDTGGAWKSTFTRTTSGILGYESAFGTTQFLGMNSGQDRSLSEFRFFINHFIIQAIQFTISDQFLRTDEYYLPKSEFSTSGSTNDKLIEELRRLVVRLQIDDVQTVVIELLKLIEAAEKGQIRDLR